MIKKKNYYKTSQATNYGLNFDSQILRTQKNNMTMKKKGSWKCIILSCYKTEPLPESEDHRRNFKNVSSFRRLSLSEASNPSSPICVEDLSNSFAGPKLHIFTFSELRLVTQGFARCNLLGEGGFGPVYKGFLDDKLRPGLEAQPVAVKSLDLDGLQGHREWMAEIIFLGQLRHPHLVKLIGYCCEEEQRLLVYEYMPRGSLENQLFRRFSAALPWSTRMKIALGAAKGLEFLHETDPPVIYRDFKSSNILLDSDFTAKLSDFGLAKDGPDGEETHVTTRVMGTQGYAAPEYIMTGHLTTMSDVYSFGVVLLELLTGKRSMDDTRQGREQSLVERLRPLLKDSNKLDRVIDTRLEGQFPGTGAQKAATLAYRCLSHQAKNRPPMCYVVKVLESLQDFDDGNFDSPFVYIVPNDEKGSFEKDQNDSSSGDHEIQSPQNNPSIRRFWRHRIKLPLSKISYSDSALYDTIGNGFSSPNCYASRK